MPDGKLTTALDEIREHEQAAVRGPWMVTAKASEDSPVIYVAGPVENSAHVLFEADWGSEADAEFIVAARTAVPRLLAALDEVLKLHTRQETPTRCWDLDLRCEKHRWTKDARYGPFEGLRENLLSVRNCPDCTCRETHPCTHCREDDWPCPTVQGISRALFGEDGS